MTVPIGEKTLYSLSRVPYGALKEFRKLAPACIYVIGVGEGGPLKIGMTCDIGKRMNGIQTSHWERVELLSHHWFASDIVARSVEADAHALLDKANKRRLGEWFDVEKEWADKTI